MPLFFSTFVAAVFAQPTPPIPKPTPPIVVKPVIVRIGPEVSAERSIAVDRKLTLSLCVSSGRIKVNGWDREEVRALVDGGNLGFRVAETSEKTGRPTWIFVTGYDSKAKTTVKNDECLAGESIELDVPRDASVNIKGSPDETRVESVEKVKIENISGNIAVRNIAAGVWATTYEGSILVERSNGSMTLNITSGGIVVFEVGQSATGDIFKARTNGGAVTMQSVDFRQVEVNSITGAINFRGKLLNGGQYTFGSQNGRVSLTVPGNERMPDQRLAGARVVHLEIPLENAVKAGPNTTGRIGKDETNCTMYLKTTSGQLRIGVEPLKK
ncbi:MAG: hypothetical protein IPK58_25920 [Acidobacteria bacterium]|nr:hypothetical protein [Acidobacteriota bacterium]